MPDWSEITEELSGNIVRTPMRSPIILFVLQCIWQGIGSLLCMLLASIGLTVLLNPSLREFLWEFIMERIFNR